MKYHIYSQEDALNYLKFRTKYKTLDHVKYIFAADIFPNINLFQNKGKYLGYLVKEFIDVSLKIKKESDRDNYFNKRINISGFLLAELFQETYMRLRKTIRDTMDNFYYFGAWKNTRNFTNFINKDNIYKLIPVILIANTFAKSLKGRWGLETDMDPELGRVQDLSRISYIGFLSHLRRVNMPIDRTIKVTAPHKLHSHQYGIMCPFETPDGAAVGYLKNLAFLAKVTAGTSPQFIRDCLLDIGVIPIENYNLKLDRNITKIFVNNSWFGIANDPINIVRTLRAYRRNALINILTSIYWNIMNNEIKIFVEAGRGVRPLIIVKNGNATVFKKEYQNWFDMIIGKYNNYTKKERSEEIYYKNEYVNPRTLKIDGKDFSKMKDEAILEELEKEGAVIEYIDPQESDGCFIAMYKHDINKFHTHCEIHPSTMLSVVTGNIPICNHNQSARNVFHAAQTKQAIGIYATNFNKRFDTFGFVQHYAQKAIVNTRHAQYTGSDNMMNGANLIVAIMTYTGFNQEDSLIINKKSIERGLFHLSYYKSITATSKKVSQYERVIFANPLKLRNEGVKISGIKHANYSLINDEGIVREGSYIPRGQTAVVIGMVLVKDVYKEVKKGLFIEQVKETTYSDVSITSDESYYGHIDKVYVGTKTLDDDTKVCKVRFLKIKIPEFGDKHSSRHGQKGVIGMILPDEQMPFTKDGIKPDLIVNPHAIPSRMTIGHLVECVYSKLCCLEGFLGDGTVYINLDYESIYNNLEKHNFNKHGNEILYNGQTGRQISTDIFIGPTYYFRLKHMVAEKINARGFGPKIQLTRQPTGGRRKAGGLRIGEMERDSLISHGISRFIKESMMERSDKYRWCVCKNCGSIPVYGTKIKNAICSLCQNSEINVIETPYTMKLLSQEFEGMGVQMRFNCDYVDMPIGEEIDDDIDYVNEENEEKDEGDEDNKKEEKTKKEVKEIKGLKELKEKNYGKMTNKELIAKVKVLYPTMKGITTKKKEELVKLLVAKDQEAKGEEPKKAEEPKEEPKEAEKKKGKKTKEEAKGEPKEEKKEKKEKVKITKTKEELKKEILTKYPTYKIKAAANKEDLAKILELSPDEIEEELKKQALKKEKKKGGDRESDDSSDEGSEDGDATGNDSGSSEESESVDNSSSKGDDSDSGDGSDESNDDEKPPATAQPVAQVASPSEPSETPQSQEPSTEGVMEKVGGNEDIKIINI